MTPDLRIQQAVVLGDARGVRVVARSDDFDEPEAERIAVLFGARPDGMPCPLAHFACPFGRKHVAVVRVEDRPGGALGFRFLVLARELYKHLGDPFAIADRYLPVWDVSGRLEELVWPVEVLPERTLEQLDSDHEDYRSRVDARFDTGAGRWQPRVVKASRTGGAVRARSVSTLLDTTASVRKYAGNILSALLIKKFL